MPVKKKKKKKVQGHLQLVFVLEIFYLRGKFQFDIKTLIKTTLITQGHKNFLKTKTLLILWKMSKKHSNVESNDQNSLIQRKQFVKDHATGGL